jgi:hypothetical protein
VPTFVVDTQAGLLQLNTHLATNVYLQGFQPSQDDMAVYAQFPRVPAFDKKVLPHLARWFKNMDTFSPRDFSRWPATRATGVAVPAPTSASSVPSSAPQQAREKDNESAKVPNSNEEKSSKKRQKEGEKRQEERQRTG